MFVDQITADSTRTLHSGPVASASGLKRDGHGPGFMVMLGDGTDILRGVVGLAGGYAAWP